jgi:GT2 family glycosyltransferase
MTSPPAATPRVSVVVLSHNRPRLLRDALASVRAQSERSLEIVLVDNPSPASPAVRALTAEFPGVRLITPATNVGFTGGMNLGLAAARGPFVVFTEDDLTLDGECVRRLVTHLDSNPQVGLVTGLMLNRDDGTIRCAGGRVRLGPVFRFEVIGEGEGDAGQYAAPFPVEYIPGALIAARRARLQEFGGFRDDFFMYHDDVELCLRVRRAGYSVVVVPAARAAHARPDSSTVSPPLAVHKVKNLYAVYLLHAEVGVLPEFFLRYAILPMIRGSGAGRRATGAALSWTASRLRRLLGDRRRLRAVTAAGRHGPR